MAFRQRVIRPYSAVVSTSEPDPQTKHQAWSALIAHSSLDCIDSGYRVWVEVPHRKELAAFGESPDEALTQFCREVSDFVATEASDALFEWLKKSTPMEEKRRTATKTQQKTIGVSSKASLIRLITEYGKGDRSTAARDLFARGFKALDRRLDNEDSKDVFDNFQAAYDALPDSPTEQWMLRLDPKAYGRAIVRAGEYGKSASNLAALCLAYALRS